jgi:AraC-like DNA-binding protein
MTENDPNLPKLLDALGVAAWHLPPAAIRQMDTHSHEEAQLCGLDGGLAILETDAGSWLCPPGRCVWIPSSMSHSLRSSGKISGWMLRLKPQSCKGLPSEPRVMALTPLLYEIVRRIAEWVDSPLMTAARRHLVDVLQDEIAAAPQVALHLPVPREPALKRLAIRLSEDADAPRDFAALAHEAGLSERSLFRGFQRETGLSPGQWRRQMHVLRSLELLADGRSVTETSLEVGYESVGAFIRAFRQVVGITPAVYAQRRNAANFCAVRIENPLP